MSERGTILHPERIKQVIRYEGIRYDTITPSDIDGFIEYKDKGWIIYEVKGRHKEVPYGQRLALQRFVEDTKKAGKSSIAIIAEHDITDPTEDIILSQCHVREVYPSDELLWRPTVRPYNLKELTDTYITYVLKGCY